MFFNFLNNNFKYFETKQNIINCLLLLKLKMIELSSTQKKFGIAVAVVLVLLAIGLGVYYGVYDKKKSPAAAAPVAADVKEGYEGGAIYPGYKNSSDYVTVMKEYDSTAAPAPALASKKASDRLDSLQKSLALPKGAKYVTPYDVDIADPKFYNFSQSPPQVILKNRQYQQADPYRGDIAIANPNNGCIIKRSTHDREAQRLSATFNPNYDTMIKQYVDENESNPASYHVRTSRKGTNVMNV